MKKPFVQKARKIDLEMLRARKLEILAEIHDQKEVMTGSFRTLIAPLAGGGQGTGIMKRFNTGIAVVDGMLIGYSMIKRIKGFFKKFRR